MAERVRKSTRKAPRGGAVGSANRASAVCGHGAMTPRRSTITACWRQDGHGLAPEHHGRVVDAGLAHERASGVDLVMQQRCSASCCCLCGCCCCSLARSCLTHHAAQQRDTAARQQRHTNSNSSQRDTTARQKLVPAAVLAAARRLCRRVWSLLCCRCMHAHWGERSGEHLTRHSSRREAVQRNSE